MARRPDVLISIGAEMNKGFAKTTKDVGKEISKIWKTVGNAKNKYSSLNKAKDSYNQKLGDIADKEVISKAKYEAKNKALYTKSDEIKSKDAVKQQDFANKDTTYNNKLANLNTTAETAKAKYETKVKELYDKIETILGNYANKEQKHANEVVALNNKLQKLQGNRYNAEQKYLNKDKDLKTTLTTSTNKRDKLVSDTQSLLQETSGLAEIKTEKQVKKALLEIEKKLTNKEAERLVINKKLAEAQKDYDKKQADFVKDEKNLANQLETGPIGAQQKRKLSAERTHAKQAKQVLTAVKKELKDTNAEITKLKTATTTTSQNIQSIQTLNTTISQTNEKIRLNNEAWAEKSRQTQASIDETNAKIKLNEDTFNEQSRQAQTGLEQTKEKLDLVNKAYDDQSEHIQTQLGETVDKIQQNNLAWETHSENVKTQLEGIDEKIKENNEEWAYHQQVVAQKIQAIRDKIAEVASKAKKLILGTIGKAVGTLFRVIGKQLKQLLSNMLAPFKEIRKNLLDGKQLMRLIVQYGFGFRSLYYLINKFKSGIKDGFTYMGSAISDVQEQLNKLQEVLYYVKSAAAAALQPLLNMLVTLKPLLERFVALFNKFATSLATFLATLTGQDYIYKATTDLDAYATALDKTTGSANDLNQALGAYDKLNVIGDDDKSSGSGSDFDTSSWFEKEDLDPDSWASKLAEAIKNAIEIVDFTDVGRMLGDKLKEAIGNIPWKTTTVNGEIKKGIEQLANEISTDFSTLLIGFFNTQDLGSQIGETIAHAMNVAIDFVNNFLTTVSEDKTVIEAIGDFILESINTALTTLDIEKLGATVRLMFSNIHDLTKKLIEGLDSDSLADIISEFILTVFTELGNKIDIFITAAQKIIPAILEGISQALSSADAESDSDVGENIATKVIAGMNVSLASMDATETGESIGNILANIPVDSLAESISILVGKIWETVVTACNTWVEENPDTFFGILKTLMAVLTAYVAAKFTFKVIGTAITKKASEWVAQGGFSALLTSISTWITSTAIPWITGTAWPAVSTFLSTILANAYLWIATVAIPWITGVAIPAIVGVLSTIGTALVTAFSAIATFVAAAWPFILAIAIAALITVAIALLVEHWDEIKQWWNEKLAEFKEWWDNSWIKETLDKISEWWDGIKEKIKKYWDKVKEWAKGKYDTFKEWLDKVKARFQEWSDAIKEKVQPIADKFTSAFNSIKSRATEFKSAFVSVFSGIWGGVKRIINSILGGIESMANGVVRGVNRLIDAINSISIDVPDWVTDLVGIDTIGFNLSRVSEVSIPRLAQGAVIPPNKEFMAVLGDQSSGTNIEAPLDTIKQALAEVMSMYGGNTQPIILQLDGKTVAKVVWDENKKRYKQTGKNYAY